MHLLYYFASGEEAGAGTTKLRKLGAARVVKSRAAAISTQVVETIAQHFFPKFADYFGLSAHTQGRSKFRGPE